MSKEFYLDKSLIVPDFASSLEGIDLVKEGAISIADDKIELTLQYEPSEKRAVRAIVRISNEEGRSIFQLSFRPKGIEAKQSQLNYFLFSEAQNKGLKGLKEYIRENLEIDMGEEDVRELNEQLASLGPEDIEDN